MKNLDRLLKFQSKNNPKILVYDNGVIRQIDGQEFEKMFGVKYVQRAVLDSNLPDDFFEHRRQVFSKTKKEDAEYYSKYFISQLEGFIEKAISMEDREDFWNLMEPTEIRYLYGKQINEGNTAPVFIGRVSDIFEDKRYDAAGYGLFANDDIVKEQFIGEASGMIERVFVENLSDATYAYMYMDRGGNPDFAEIINALKAGNATRFFNHSSKNDNVKTIGVCHHDLYVMFSIATKDIKKGDQLFLDYGEGYWKGLGIEPIKF